MDAIEKHARTLSALIMSEISDKLRDGDLGTIYIKDLATLNSALENFIIKYGESQDGE